MTEEEIKQATCHVSGKDESGTGWLVAPQLVLTALHCVEAAVSAGEPILLRFGVGQTAVEHTASVGPHDKELDVCLLQLSTSPGLEPVPMSSDGLRPGERWSAFGYPVTKLQIGHAVRGEIQQVLTDRVHRVDLDLSVEPGTHLSDYTGLSGSAFIVAGVCKGMLLLSIDSAIGAVSLEKLKPFLEANGLLQSKPSTSTEAIAIGSRPVFDELFESTIQERCGGYVFLEGSPGVGKSTYCKQFSPESTTLDDLGVYAFTDRARGSTPVQQVQPEAFFDWCNSLLSKRATGKPARLMELSYRQLVEMTGKVLKSLAERNHKSGKVGVLFIDGINEAASSGDEALRRFVNLLPEELPEGLVVVVTGVGLDTIAANLAPIFQRAPRLTLPTLDRDVQYGVCLGFLDRDKATTSTVAALCDRALGHPLYLRYLADMVNSGATEVDIAELPVFSGQIEDYYETIWAKLLAIDDVINLLAILARLRWGIPVPKLTGMLTPSELAVLPSTLLRIRHLLASPENTEIYHPSFTQFVIHKTAVLDEWIHSRLVGFCASSQSEDYGVLNKVYHALRGGPDSMLQGIRECKQTWVDDSVLRGAEPDVLLTDIDDALDGAIEAGGAVDIVRLLLLSQRLTFRYNVLFVESAQLVASALTALGKTESALRHIVRNGRLVVAVDEACSVANALTHQGSAGHALEVLELLQREINQVFEKMGSAEGIGTGEFLRAVDARLHAFSLARAAGDDPPFSRLLRAVVTGVLRAPKSRFSEEEGNHVLRKLTGSMAGAQLCLQADYRPFRELALPVEVDERHQLLIFLQTLVHAQMYSELYGIPLAQDKVVLLLEDVARVVGAPLEPGDRDILFTDALIEAGAAPDVVATYSVGVELGDGSLPLHKTNRADPDESGFEDAMLLLRASAFLTNSHSKPNVQAPAVGDWERDLEALARAVAWCDGKARWASAAKAQSDLDYVRSFLLEQLLPSLEFPLAERIHWDASYFIPETVIPRLYLQLAKLVLDCFPQHSFALLEVLERLFDAQLGLYNEGFREALQQVLRAFIERKPDGELADKVFALTLRWRDYVAANVENRFELVPELLQIVPLLTQLGADEEALRTYRLVLSLSMGPSWYKEDQLSMMSSTLEALPAASPVQGSSLAQIAALLERATGEMTFQRYVRADKGTFIGELCRRSRFGDAIRYFQHQSCGTLDELYSQAKSGNLDRVSALVGMRFPGAALEEQAALLALLRRTGNKATWQVRWALLEVYLHGDERHLADWGSQCASIISELTGRPSDLEAVGARVRSVAASLSAERAWLLLRSLVAGLPPEMHEEFEPYSKAARAKLDAERVEQMASTMGLELNESEAQGTEAATRKQCRRKVSDDDQEEDRFVLPGTFGERSAVRTSRAQLDAAREHLRRRSFAAAVQESVNALMTLQAAGWSIWADNHSGAFADEIIRTHVSTADEVARIYGQLAIEERHTQRWRIASHLITQVSQKLDAEQQAAMLSAAIEHVSQIVGPAAPAQFEYMGASPVASATESLTELLLWTLDHPSWARRDAAASMVLWLARQDSSWLPQLANLAFSMDTRNRADIAAAALDILSRENSATLWGHIEPHLDIPHVIAHCQHICRFAIFVRVAERATKRGVESAAAALKAALDRFPENTPLLAEAADPGPPAYVPSTLYLLWHELSELGVLSIAERERFNSEMASLCRPLPVSTALELEVLVAQGARENADSSNGRWATTIRYALNTALFQPMPASKLKKVEATLRTYNPESLQEPPNGDELLASLIEHLECGRERSYLPSQGDLVFLNLECSLEQDSRPVIVELTAHLVPPRQLQRGKTTPPSFKSTELPHPGPQEPLAVCGRAMPDIAYFGCLSPAIATPRFLQLIGANADNTVRYHWRHGSTVTNLASSRRHEAALLAIQRSALALPDGWRMEWVLRLNGNVKAVLNKF